VDETGDIGHVGFILLAVEDVDVIILQGSSEA
jgi:hypothetical protein